MKRIKKIGELLVATRKCTIANMRYMEVPREYAKGQYLYMREVHFLTQIPDEDILPISKLAEKLDISQGAVSQIAKRLEKKGLIIRGSDPMDKRKKIVSLSMEGRVVKTNHIEYDKSKHKEVNERLKEFSDEDIEIILKYEKTMECLYNDATTEVEKNNIDKK